MLTGSRLLLGGLGAAVVALAVALGVVLAVDGDGWDHPMAGAHHGGMGPMQGHTQDWGAMQERMRDFMGEDAYQEMLDHMAAMHPDGVPQMPWGPGRMMP